MKSTYTRPTVVNFDLPMGCLPVTAFIAHPQVDGKSWMWALETARVPS